MNTKTKSALRSTLEQESAALEARLQIGRAHV